MRAEEDSGAADGADGGEDGDDSKPRNGLPWDGSDRDYMYEELLGAAPLFVESSHLSEKTVNIQNLYKILANAAAMSSQRQPCPFSKDSCPCSGFKRRCLAQSGCPHRAVHLIQRPKPRSTPCAYLVNC